MPPNRRLSGFFFNEKRFCWDCSFYQKCSVDLKYAKNAFAAGLRRSPDPLVGWEGGHPLPNTHSSRRFWRLDSLASGSQLLWLPSVKSWL